jgi:hypothetical protein
MNSGCALSSQERSRPWPSSIGSGQKVGHAFAKSRYSSSESPVLANRSRPAHNHCFGFSNPVVRKNSVQRFSVQCNNVTLTKTCYRINSPGAPRISSLRTVVADCYGSVRLRKVDDRSLKTRILYLKIHRLWLSRSCTLSRRTAKVYSINRPYQPSAMMRRAAIELR